MALPQHNHLLLNGFTHNPPRNEEATIAWMEGFIKAIDMKILQGPFASYVDVEGNRGLTCVAMIETSHVAMHVWDEPVPAKVQFDLYTCGSLPEVHTLTQIVDFLQLEDYEYMILEREHGFNVVSSKAIHGKSGLTLFDETGSV